MVGVLAPNPVDLEFNKERESTCDIQNMEAILVKENLRRQKSALRNHVQTHFQLTVSGANGAIGVLAPKLVGQA